MAADLASQRPGGDALKPVPVADGEDLEMKHSFYDQWQRKGKSRVSTRGEEESKGGSSTSRQESSELKQIIIFNFIQGLQFTGLGLLLIQRKDFSFMLYISASRAVATKYFLFKLRYLKPCYFAVQCTLAHTFFNY